MAVIVAALCITVLWCWFNRQQDHAIQETKLTTVNESHRQVMAVKKVAEPSTNHVAAIIPEKNRNVRIEHGKTVIVCKSQTNTIGTIIERLTLADGSTIKKVYPPKSIFANPSDDLIATVLSVKPGQAMPPLPDLSTIDTDFERSLLEPIRINDEDSDATKELKMAVKEARAYIAAEIKNGRTVAECLMAHREEMENISDSHAMAVRELQKMRSDGASNDEVKAFRERINEVFKERGIPTLPDSTEEPFRRR